MAFLRYNQRTTAYNFLGGKCKCGESDYDVLTLHHRNPEEKKFALSEAWGRYSWGVIFEEVKKCTLLCANCHLKLHANENQKSFKMVEAYYGGVAERHTLGT